MMKKTGFYIVLAICFALSGTAVAQGIPASDPAQFPEFIIDYLQNDAADDFAKAHKMYNDASRKAVGVQNAATKLSQKNEMKKVLLGRSSTLSRTFRMFGIKYTDPMSAMSSRTTNAIKSEIIRPTSKEAKMKKTQRQLNRIQQRQIQQAQAMAVHSLASAWAAQTEASAKANVIDSIGNDISGNATQTDILVALLRVSAEQVADLNARISLLSEHLSQESISAIQKIDEGE